MGEERTERKGEQEHQPPPMPRPLVELIASIVARVQREEAQKDRAA